MQSLNVTGEYQYIAGWATSVTYGSRSDILQEVRLPILENSVCEDRYTKLNVIKSEKQFDETVLCAGMSNKVFFCKYFNVNIFIITSR